MSAIRTIFSEGFRAFFLAAGLFGALEIAVWLGWYGLMLEGWALPLPSLIPPAIAPHLWHGHEMIFGYGAAALGGFFLTAVPNWTGAKAAPGRFVAMAFGLWLAGRLAMVAGGALPPLLVALADLAFVPLLAAKIATQLLARPKPQNLIFLLVLSVYWAANLVCHLEWMGWPMGDAYAGMRAGLAALAALIVILGGRVTPAFTRNAMLQAGREDRLPVNPGALAAASGLVCGLLPFAYLAGLPEGVLGGLALLGGGLAALRLTGWRSGATRGQPILWVLHLSYGMNALGLMALGAAGLGLGTEVGALHLLAIGGIGGMTLAFMSRASLGHSGRSLIAPGVVALAYGLVPLAALLRWVASSLPALHAPLVLAAGGLWLAAFGLYLIGLMPVLATPRLPRAPG